MRLLLLVGAIIAALAALVFGIAFFPPNAIERTLPGAFFRLPPPAGAPILYLTIDDAPNEFTADIAGVLAEHGARATFFVIGGQLAADHRNVTGKLVQNGHAIGNHDIDNRGSLKSYNRDRQALLDDVAYTSALTEQKLGLQPRLFRPGCGWIDERMLTDIRAAGYSVVLGNVYPHDCQVGAIPTIGRWLVFHLTWMRIWQLELTQGSASGSIVILHSREPTVYVLQRLLPWLKARGYSVEPVPKNLE